MRGHSCASERAGEQVCRTAAAARAGGHRTRPVAQTARSSACPQPAGGRPRPWREMDKQGGRWTRSGGGLARTEPLGHPGPCKRNPLRIAEIWTIQRRGLREAQVTWPCTGPSPGETVRAFPRELWEGPRLLHHPRPLQAAATPGQPPRSVPP